MEPLVHIEGLTKRYSRRRFLGSLEAVVALDGVSLSILPRTTFAIVGESGSGKTTLALCLACLERPTSGSIWFDGRDVTLLNEAELRAVRPQAQIVFQDPVSSLNPRWRVLEILMEPLLIQRRCAPKECRERAHWLLERVGLSADLVSRMARELSGGQRHRLAIARALALEPKLLIFDEALSALDCSVQAQVANLLVELQRSLGLTYVFITHDIAMAAHLADGIAVMHNGRIVEQGAAEKVLRLPEQETTKALVAAMPRLVPAANSFGQP